MELTTCMTFNVLDLFRLLTVVGNMNAHDFVTSLERCTDTLGATGIWWLPDRLIQGIWAGGLTNLPSDWRDVDPKYRFLFMLIVAVDVNFRLKNVLCTNECHDLPLGPRWGAFVEPTTYKEHLKNYVGEDDISTCIAFAALLQKDTWLTTGLCTSGVGGCVCARHDYANMDSVVMAALAGLTFMMLTISYDIACQWKKGLRNQSALLLPDIQLNLNKVDVQCGLPVWHATSHQADCTNKNSLSFLVGVGKSDGEGVERMWADLNPAAFHTKQMGYGNRIDTLEDKINSHNFLKNLRQGDALQRKLIVTIAELACQSEAFKRMSSTVLKELKEQWQEKIDAFIQDHSSPNPYILPTGPTEAETQMVLKKDEEEEARKGERCCMGPKLCTFHNLQEIYTPGATREVTAAKAARDMDEAAPRAEHVKLWLPSELTMERRASGCQHGVATMELHLWEAQCCVVGCMQNTILSASAMGTSLAKVRSMKVRSLIDQIRTCAHFRELTMEHLMLDGDVAESDETARKKLTAAGAGKKGRVPRHLKGSSKKLASWIWTVGMENARPGGEALLEEEQDAQDEEALHASIQVEWSHVKARRVRWEEEVLLLREEMCRVLLYLEWEAAQWEVRAGVEWEELSAEGRSGLTAYTLQQVDMYRELVGAVEEEDGVDE
ncbi:hypothetical protein C8J57DRAFT_1491395 [Mycena rebaudengoi]|nr:hypothetical protein C8J57DRAFT_1491395 [Mycena rebaudengoi]